MQQPATQADDDPPWLKSYPPGIDWDAPIAIAPMGELLDKAVGLHGAKPAIDFLGKHYSYAELGSLVNRAVKGLQAIGVKPGVKVGLCLPNTPYFVICFFAVLKAGGTLVNFNPLYTERELAHQIEDSDCDIMVSLDLVSLYSKLAKLIGHCRLKKVIVCRMAEALPFPRNLLYPWVMRRDLAQVPADDIHIPFERLIANDGAAQLPPIDPRTAIALLQYTGGTTGVPKGAMLTHANLYANAEQCARWFSHIGDGPKRTLGVLPLFHVFAMTVVMSWAVHEGAEMVLLPRFQVTELMKTITKKKPSAMPGVPTLFNAILNAPDLGKYNLRSLHYCVSGGASLSNELRLAFEKATGARLLEGYGLSETSPVICCNPVEGENRPGSVGLPYPATTIRIYSLETPRRPLPVGETGEICVAGPQVMAGYWKRPDETAKVMVDGYLATGDVGHMDKDGYVFITDRLKEMINASGFKVYPRNIEEAILLNPAVLECAVVGLPDPYRGQTVKAFVALKPGATLTAEALTRFLADKLTPIEMPKQIEFRASLPKTTIGKISKKMLLEEGKAA